MHGFLSLSFCCHNLRSERTAIFNAVLTGNLSRACQEKGKSNKRQELVQSESKFHPKTEQI